MENTISRAVLTISTRSCGARIVCDNLLVHNRRIVFLTGYGPTQEVRAFAQLLKLDVQKNFAAETLTGEAIAEAPYKAETSHPVWVTKAQDGYSLIHVLPDHDRFVLTKSEEEARTIHRRLLEQKHFVHQAWFDLLFQEMPEIKPLVGDMKARVRHLDIQKRIIDGVRAGELTFPSPTATLTVQKTGDKEEEGELKAA